MLKFTFKNILPTRPQPDKCQLIFQFDQMTTTAAPSSVVNMNRLSGEGSSAAAGEKCLEVRPVNGAANDGLAF